MNGPLSDLRVIEMGQLLAGPFCGQLLADFGADVIKIEAPATGDPMREWGREKAQGASLWWPVVARNKRSVTLNLREAEGQELARQLIGEADILIENFRPGTLEKWGLDPEDLRATRPELIVVRVSGYGQTGPYADRPGYGARRWAGFERSSANPTALRLVPASRSATRLRRSSRASGRWWRSIIATTPVEVRSWIQRCTRRCSG